MDLTTILAVVTAVAVTAGAVIALVGNRDRTRFNLPVAEVSCRTDDVAGESDPEVARFWLDQRDGAPEWLVAAVWIRWRRLGPRWIAAATDEEAAYDPRTESVQWKRCAAYNPPVPYGNLLLHPDTPDLVSLRFAIALRSWPNKRSCLEVRYRVRDSASDDHTAIGPQNKI